MDEIDVSEMARQLAARRRREERTCLHCGSHFTGSVLRRYCSGKCRVAAVRVRHKAKAQQAAGSVSTA